MDLNSNSNYLWILVYASQWFYLVKLLRKFDSSNTPVGAGVELKYFNFKDLYLNFADFNWFLGNYYGLFWFIMSVPKHLPEYVLFPRYVVFQQ